MRIPKEKTKRDRSGFSMIEVITSVFIFSLMMVAVFGVLATLMQRRTDIRKSQENTERLSVAMTTVANTMRMSSFGSCSVSSCTVTENSGSDKTFAFTGSDTLTDGSAYPVLTDVSGSFSAYGTAAGQAPRITIRMFAPGHPETAVQTTVSLRNY